MAEATRLTRAGQLLQATAIIKDTLRGLLTKKASSHATACTDDKIDVSFRVIDEAPSPTVGPPPRRLPSPGSAAAEFTKGRRSNTAAYRRLATIARRVSIANPCACNTEGHLGFARCFARIRADMVGLYPGPSRIGHAATFGQADNLPTAPIRTMRHPSLQALRPQRIYRASLTVGGHAPWLHAGP